MVSSVRHAGKMPKCSGLSGIGGSKQMKMCQDIWPSKGWSFSSKQVDGCREKVYLTLKEVPDDSMTISKGGVVVNGIFY
eukprot:1361243-Ditylum_brightwellii.AAC.1